MKPITHHLTERQIERLQAESRRSGLPVAELIRRAIDAWLAGLDKPRKERR